VFAEAYTLGWESDRAAAVARADPRLLRTALPAGHPDPSAPVSVQARRA
jgi:hypothetical protein